MKPIEEFRQRLQEEEALKGDAVEWWAVLEKMCETQSLTAVDIEEIAALLIAQSHSIEEEHSTEAATEYLKEQVAKLVKLMEEKKALLRANDRLVKENRERREEIAQGRRDIAELLSRLPQA